MHTQHLDSKGNTIPSVSEVPNITKEFFFEDMSGYQDWLCRETHPKEARCCTKAQRDYYQECADLGNDVHSLMEAFLKGESFENGVPQYQAEVFAPVAEFFKESGYSPLYISSEEPNEEIGTFAIELKMTGKEFGGTLDTAGTFSKPFWDKQRKTFWQSPPLESGGCPVLPHSTDVWIVDLKIKSKLDPLHGLQLYGYSKLLDEVYGIKADWGLIIRREKKLDKTPEIQLRGYYLPAYKKIWDSAFHCWKFLND